MTLKLNGSTYLFMFLIIERLGFYKIDIINFESGMWGLEIHVSANTYVHMHMDFNQEKGQHFIFSLETPNFVIVTSEWQDSHLLDAFL